VPAARTRGSLAARLLLIPAQLRIEELLAGLGLAVFWLLERLRVSSFDPWTQFFREGLRFYLGLGALVVVVEAVRAGRALVRVRRTTARPSPDDSPSGPRTLPRALLQVGLALVRFLRDWAPFVLLLTIYENLIWLVARVNPRLWDASLQRLDDLLLFGHSTFWLERFVTAGRTEWFSFFYNVLFIYPILVGGLVYLLRRFAAYRQWVLTFSLAGYMGFVGYLAVPVIGPAYTYDKVYRSDLSGRPINRDLDLVDAAAADEAPGEAPAMAFYALARRLNQPSHYGNQVPRNCFPSLHTAWGLIILAFCFQRLRPLFWIVLLPVLNLIVATVYLRFHYVVDLLAGGMLTLLTLALVPRLLAWEGRLRAWVAAKADPGPSPPEPPPLAGRRIPLGLGVGLPVAFYAAVGAYLALSSPSAVGAHEVARVIHQHRLDRVPDPVDHSLGARFGDALVLEAADLDRSEGAAGDKLRLYLYWRSLKPIGRHWKVFVHVEGSSWRLNRDHHPVAGLVRLADLSPGDVLRDPMVLHLDPRRGRGEVRVHVGLFDERWVERRMPLRNPEQVPNDGRNRVRAATVRIR